MECLVVVHKAQLGEDMQKKLFVSLDVMKQKIVETNNQFKDPKRQIHCCLHSRVLESV